jgi:hypothetical protein
MNILLASLGHMSECFVATCLLKKLSKQGDVYVATVFDSTADVFEYSKYVKKVFTLKHRQDEENLLLNHYDLLINLSPSINDSLLNVDKCVGINYTDPKDKYKNILYGNKKTNKNMFQIYNQLAGMSWRGEGADVNYKPRNKSVKNRTGILLSNYNLKEYLYTELKLKESRLWYIPQKQHIHKKMDEINRCKRIITDDFLTLNIALFLRKEVYFLKTINYNFKIELFGSGKVFDVPKHFLQ